MSLAVPLNDHPVTCHRKSCPYKSSDASFRLLHIGIYSLVDGGRNPMPGHRTTPFDSGREEGWSGTCVYYRHGHPTYSGKSRSSRLFLDRIRPTDMLPTMSRRSDNSWTWLGFRIQGRRSATVPSCHPRGRAGRAGCPEPRKMYTMRTLYMAGNVSLGSLA